jgi:hypothetical protein
MDAHDFERELGAWIDGELPAERAARMQSAVDASPELARRAEFERRLHARLKRAMTSDADAAVVATMLERARASAPPAGGLRRRPWATWRAVAAAIVIGFVGAWWFCVPPFECAYLQAITAAAQDSAAAPGADADATAARLRLPSAIGDTVASPTAAATQFVVGGRHISVVRLAYVHANGAVAFHVLACESPNFHPSIRRHLVRDDKGWWNADIHENCTWAFQSADAQVVYAVTGPETDEVALYAAAKVLRDDVK